MGNGRFQAINILKDAGIHVPANMNRWDAAAQKWIPCGTTTRWIAFEGGEHRIMVNGCYYAVDVQTSKWRQTA